MLFKVKKETYDRIEALVLDSPIGKTTDTTTFISYLFNHVLQRISGGEVDLESVCPVTSLHVLRYESPTYPEDNYFVGGFVTEEEALEAAQEVSGVYDDRFYHRSKPKNYKVEEITLME